MVGPHQTPEEHVIPALAHDASQRHGSRSPEGHGQSNADRHLRDRHHARRCEKVERVVSKLRRGGEEISAEQFVVWGRLGFRFSEV